MTIKLHRRPLQDGNAARKLESERTTRGIPKNLEWNGRLRSRSGALLEVAMSFSLLHCTCPHCASRLGLKDLRLIGRRIKCPKCQRPFLVENAGDIKVEESGSL